MNSEFGIAVRSPTDVTSFTLLLFLVWLITFGAGRLSVDALLRRIVGTSPAAAVTTGPGSR